MNNLISCRQTRKGDWMVCAVAQATYGPGVYKTGSPAPGYTTGATYGRYPNEQIAREEATRIAAERNASVVEWQYPAKNPQFIDLPRQYPTKKDYDTFADAEADGWVHINPSKTLHVHRGKKIYVRDVTPGRSYGYDLVIAVDGATEELASSAQVWATSELRPSGGSGLFDVRFRTGDIVDAIERGIGLIDWLPIV